MGSPFPGPQTPREGAAGMREEREGLFCPGMWEVGASLFRGFLSPLACPDLIKRVNCSLECSGRRWEIASQGRPVGAGGHPGGSRREMKGKRREGHEGSGGSR